MLVILSQNVQVLRIRRGHQLGMEGPGDWKESTKISPSLEEGGVLMILAKPELPSSAGFREVFQEFPSHLFVPYAVVFLAGILLVHRLR